MRPVAPLLRLALCLSTAAPLVSAWPSWLPELDSLIVRDDSGSSASATPTPTDDSSSATDAPLNTAKPTPTGKDASASGSATGKGGSSTGKDQPKKTQFPPDAPPGGVVMETPATTAIGQALYKIGDFVTLGWNYTNLLGTPTAIDVLASCSTASETWTLTANMSFATNASVVWDTSKDADSLETPLLTAMYTLIIKDSDAQISDVPAPGFLGTFNQFTFGLYAGRPYTPFPEWHCTGCNAAAGQFDFTAVRLAITMSLITVLSFTWFVSGLGLE